MWAFFTWLWDWVTWFFGLLVPVAESAKGGRLLKVLLWTIHILVVLAVGYLLYLAVAKGKFLYGWLDRIDPRIKDFYLVIVFGLFYVLGWLCWWALKLVRFEEKVVAHDDITRAWEEARAALAHHRIDPRRVPLFLVLGRPDAAEQALFEAGFKGGRLEMPVQYVPQRDAPLHVYASRDAIYVTCAGAALLGVHAATLAAEENIPIAPTRLAFQTNENILATLPPGSLAAKELQAIIAQAASQGRPPTLEEKIRMRRRVREERARLLDDERQIAYQASRLRYLCQLLGRERAPWCGINGILLLFPLVGTETMQDAFDTGTICQRDLQVVRRVLRVHCPVVALICDLEMLPGFQELAQHFDPKRLDNRIGQRYPMNPLLGKGNPLDTTEAAFDSLGQWVCSVLFPSWIHKSFTVENTPTAAARQAAVATSTALYNLMVEMSRREKHLGRLLRYALATGHEEPLWLAGCYLAGTGTRPHEHAFVGGVFRRMQVQQKNEYLPNCVRWTREAREEEAYYRRRLGWARGIRAALVAANLALIGWLVWSFLGDRKGT